MAGDGSELPLSLSVLFMYPAFVYLAQLCGIHVLAPSGMPVFLGLFTVCLAIDVLARRDRFLVGAKDLLGSLAVCALGVGSFLWVMSPTDVIPASDAIAVPVFARIFLELGFVPNVIGAEQRVPLIYPPGFPILLTDLFKVFSPITVIVIFKYICVVAVGVTPFTWAWACRRLFMSSEVSLTLVGLAMFGGFITFDRTLVFALAIAGKNAQLFQSALIPVFFTYLVSVRTIGSCVVMAVCCSGMFLIHYSGLYVTTLLLASWSCIHLWRNRDLLSCIRPWATFSVGVILFLPRAMDASSKAASVNITSTPYVVFNWDLLSVVTTELNNFIFIFNEVGIAWPYKGLYAAAIFLAAVLCLLGQRFCRRGLLTLDARSVGLGSAFWFCLLSWIGSALLGYGMLPAPGINLDFTRWFAYNLFSAAIGMSVVIACSCIRRRGVTATLAVVASGYGLWSSFDDLSGARGWIKDHAFPIADIRRVARVLPTSTPCQLITQNGGPGPFMYQMPREAEYVPVVSRCEVISGGYIASDSTNLDPSGAPTPEFLEKRGEKGLLFFLGGNISAKLMSKRYMSSGITFEHVRSVEKLGLWRMSLPNKKATPEIQNP